ncbi:hypothetical protein M409DRAFT_26960 [Zasmidium cellare ATCC 36951]|uniref:Queuosine 5'-phosphate N-glycosylase/hydrolase n=1 Tax=Zasmidium cellare ATCC 36951 TaxID=1080233 RepID=A0A6A6C7A7_ZASCE|nr:uncharacterized protein M409DRAFT_26960 [Zasmidium cellare ATCC 36951]KAF2162723.1 hypothetical protein M409DRAFT_26960 [Zasmidium cellare ATCC 36951]
MSDDEADPELLELLRQSLGISRPTHGEVSSDTGVLRDADHVYSNAIDVSIDMYGTKAAAAEIYRSMQEKSYSTETWSQHELHPRTSEGFDEVAILNFVFTMDLLNFSFWSELSSEERYQVEYRGKRWTGYNSLVASLRRALDEGIAITTPRFWRSQRCSDETLAHVFRSATAEPIPLLDERISILREAGDVLRENFASDEDEDEIEVVKGAERDDDPSQSSNAIANGEFDEGSEYIESLRADIDGPTDDRILANTTDTQATNELASQTPSTRPEPSNLQVQAEVVDASTSHDRPEIASDSGLASNANTNTAVQSEAANEQPAIAHANSSHIDVTSIDHITNGDTTHIPDAQQDSVRPDHAVVRLIQRADRSAGKLVNLLAHHFPSFRDEYRFEGRKVRLLKRAQIFVADFWAALNGSGLGEFHDIDHLTMFADYRVPQVLHSLGVLVFSPPLDHRIRSLGRIESGHTWEVQLRGCSIWAVELIRREIVRAHPEATQVNAVLIDFFLYDLAKEREALAFPTIEPGAATTSA